MSAARGRKRRGGHDEHEGHAGPDERWLVTYADMLTLLMVLFIVLFAISQVDSKKFHQLSASLASAFNGGDKSVFEGSQGLQADSGSDISPQLRQVDVDTGVTQDLPAEVDTKKPASPAAQSGGGSAEGEQSGGTVDGEAALTSLGGKISDAFTAAGMPGAAQTTVDRRGLTVSIATSDVVFGGNSADLLPDGQKVLGVLVPVLAEVANRVEIDGHTNQQQVSTDPYPSGWELSSARASSVVRFFVDRGISAGRLSAVGMSDQRPLYPPSDPRAVTLNRRVDVVVLSP